MISLSECVAVTYVAATLGFVAWSAWSDLAVRVIPNCACGAIAALGVMHRLSVGFEAALVSLGIALAAFAVLVVMHARGVMGGGDVKLIAASVLGFSPAGALRFIVVTAIVGGVLAALHLTVRAMSARVTLHAAGRVGSAGWLPRRVLASEIWRIRKHGSLPYGVAIAGGSIWVLLTGSGG